MNSMVVFLRRVLEICRRICRFLRFIRMMDPLPPSFAKLTKMKTLDMSENHFTGNLPPEIVNLKQDPTTCFKSV